MAKLKEQKQKPPEKGKKTPEKEEKTQEKKQKLTKKGKEPQEEKQKPAKKGKEPLEKKQKAQKKGHEQSVDTVDAGDEFLIETQKVNTNRLAKFIAVPVMIILLVVVGYVGLVLLPMDSAGVVYSAVRINEIMPSSGACPNADGVFSDYIELYNDSDSDVDISGFQLTDNELAAGLIFSGETIVPAHGYLVISCAGNTTVRGSSALYSSFSISKDGGETITLKNPYGKTADSVTTEKLSKNEAMVFTANGQWGTFSTGTPGFENSTAGREAYMDSLREDSGIIISELMSKNITSISSKSGEQFDWIELTNTSDASINLGGYRISDNTLQLSGYILPAYELNPEETLVIFASGLSEYSDGEIHTDFSLDSDGETLLLISPQGKLVCTVEYPGMPDNSSYMLQNGEYVVSAFSSPGSTQTEPEENEYEGLTISELMPVNTVGLMDSDGDFSDWIELTNDSSKDYNLSGCWLSVNSSDVFSWQLPDTTIKSGECLVVFASGKDEDEGKELHTSFKLTSDSGTVVLTSPRGYTIDFVSYESSQPDLSLERTPDGLVSTAHSSPGYINGEQGYIAYQETQIADSDIIISEAMTANDTVLAQSYGIYYDWIEIKNNSDTSLQLRNYYLSDDADNLKMWQMPDITLEPAEYIVFLCSGDGQLTGEKYTHTNFSLNAETETLFLCDSDGDISDRLLLCDIPANASAGRMDGQNGIFLFQEPTPGKQNSGGVRAVSTAPYSTTQTGLYDIESLAIPLFAEGEIYYTTDGSWPSSRSKEYTEPITITKSTVIRAISYSDGSMKSSVTTLSYFLNEGNTLPIMSLSASPTDLWNSSKGIYSEYNAFRDWEKDAHIEFFDPAGEGFSIDCGLSLFGGGTRLVSAKKSFQVRFRSIYGDKSLCYEVFEDCDVNEFKSLVFRAGQDSRHTIFRDELFSSIALEESPTLLAQHYRYCLLFINGKYFGIYCIKERLGDDYYAAHYNVPIDSVEVIKGPVSRSTEIYSLMSFVQKNDMRINENYEYVESKLDIDSLIDWYVFEACSGNNDISGNVRYIRSSEGDGKWRLALFDLDFTLRWPINDFAWLYNDSNQHSIFLKGLMRNPEFKDRFLSRFGYLLENVFTEEKLQARIDDFADEIWGDIERERKKWHSNLEYDEALEIISRVLHTYDYQGRIINSVCRTLSLSSEEKTKYFGFYTS